MMPAPAMTILINQLGTGAIPADEEQRLVAEGTKFAAYFQPSRGKPILVTSVHEDMYARWWQLLAANYDREFGLPAQYRIPAPVLAAP